jgi:8-oxo-dGTP pyrophosphatase MutT (NUDIX family)
MCMKNDLQLPKMLESKLVFDEFLKVRKDLLLFPDGKTYPYYVVSTVPASTAIVALSPHNELLITQEYRHAVNTTVYGCPGGNLDKGEDSIAAARRELLEETGCIATSFEIIGETYPLPGIYQHKTYYVLAKGAKLEKNPEFDGPEILNSSFMTLDEVKRITRESKAVDGILCQALYFFELWNR